MLVRAVRAILVFAAFVALLWAALIATPMWVTRWRMHRLLTDYQSIYPTQSTWADARRLMTRWGRWGHYSGGCNSTECEYSIAVDDTYTSWIEKLSEKNQNRIYNSRALKLINRMGYRTSELEVRLHVLDGKIARTENAMLLEVVDDGSPEHFEYTLIITARSRSNLSKYPRSASDEAGVYGRSTQLDLHPDYSVSRPGGCTICIKDDIAFTPTLPREVMVKLTSYNLSCLTQLHSCTTVGDLLPFGSGWHLWDEGPSSLYPSQTNEALPCGTEPRALARDATTVLQVEPLSTRSAFKEYENEPSRELVQVRILRAWKAPLHDPTGTTIQVSPFQGEATGLPYSAATAPEHLQPGHRVFLFLPENAPTDFSNGEQHGPVAYTLDRCGVIEDTPANLAAIELGIAQDVTYRRPLQNTGWW